MEVPIEDLNRCRAILMLKAAHVGNNEVASILHISTSTVGAVDHWFKELPDAEANDFCEEKAMADAYYFEIVVQEPGLTLAERDILVKMSSKYLLNHYCKKNTAPKTPLLTPDRRQHYARLSKAAEKLRLNIKDIKASAGKLVGNATQGYLELPPGGTQELRNVDRLDAACLLSHLKATIAEFKGIDDWENLATKDLLVQKVPDSLVKKLKEVSHGLALKGTCNICASWLGES